MASAAELQAHIQELLDQLPVLCLDMAPNGLSSISHIASLESQQQQEALAQLLAAMKVHRCQLCGTKSQQLQLLLRTELQFSSKAVQAAAGHFACGACRQASSTTGVMQQANTALAQCLEPSASSSTNAIQHLAAVNSAPEHLTSNPEALARWGQELLCRAYAMRVVASSMRGWRLLLPDGRPVQLGQEGTAVRLAQTLLQQQSEQHAPQPGGGTGKLERQKKGEALQNGSLSAHAELQQPLRKAGANGVKVPLQQQAQAATPATKKKAKQHLQAGDPVKVTPSPRGTPQAAQPDAPAMPATAAAAGTGKKVKRPRASAAAAVAGAVIPAGAKTPAKRADKAASSAAAAAGVMTVGRKLKQRVQPGDQPQAPGTGKSLKLKKRRLSA